VIAVQYEYVESSSLCYPGYIKVLCVVDRHVSPPWTLLAWPGSCTQSASELGGHCQSAHNTCSPLRTEYRCASMAL
jgi:hypothetical protein